MEEEKLLLEEKYSSVDAEVADKTRKLKKLRKADITTAKNYLNADEVGDSAAVSAAFGPNWKRLREVKQKYDPANVFHLNQNIKP